MFLLNGLPQLSEVDAHLVSESLTLLSGGFIFIGPQSHALEISVFRLKGIQVSCCVISPHFEFDSEYLSHLLQVHWAHWTNLGRSVFSDRKLDCFFGERFHSEALGGGLERRLNRVKGSIGTGRGAQCPV